MGRRLSSVRESVERRFGLGAPSVAIRWVNKLFCGSSIQPVARVGRPRNSGTRAPNHKLNRFQVSRRIKLMNKCLEAEVGGRLLLTVR